MYIREELGRLYNGGVCRAHYQHVSHVKHEMQIWAVFRSYISHRNESNAHASGMWFNSSFDKIFMHNGVPCVIVELSRIYNDFIIILCDINGVIYYVELRDISDTSAVESYITEFHLEGF